MRNLVIGLSIIIGVTLLGVCACAKPAVSEPYKEMLDSVMSYIKQNHPDAAPFINDNIVFTLSSSTGKDTQGYSGATYTGGEWTVTIGRTIVPDSVDGIMADYNNGQIVWIGNSKNGLIEEKSYTKAK